MTRPVPALATPAVTVDLDILARNIRKMQEYCGGHGLRFRPHVKTQVTKETLPTRPRYPIHARVGFPPSLQAGREGEVGGPGGFQIQFPAEASIMGIR